MNKHHVETWRKDEDHKLIVRKWAHIGTAGSRSSHAQSVDFYSHYEKTGGQGQDIG
jgi:hypothetical protein